MLRVWMPHPPGGAFEEEVRARLPANVRATMEERRPTPAAYDVLVAGRPEEADLDASPHLSSVVIPFAGLPRVTRARLLARPRLRVFNLHHNAAPVAELAVALLLAAARRIVPADRALRRGDWRMRYQEEGRGLLLDGARALVVGRGAIGRRVEHILRAFGMTVAVIGRGADGNPGELERRLEEADVVVLAVPLTDETRGLLDAGHLAHIGPRGVLVNVSRGEVVDEGALYEALASGRLGAAGLDVWWRYPSSVEARGDTPPSAFPFHDLENVVLSPHSAGHADRTERLRAQHLADLLGQLARGEVPASRVDLQVGY